MVCRKIFRATSFLATKKMAVDGRRLLGALRSNADTGPCRFPMLPQSYSSSPPLSVGKGSCTCLACVKRGTTHPQLVRVDA